MRPPLVLTVYPTAPDRPPGTGRDVGTWAHNRHDERLVMMGKRLTSPQLAAEWWKQDSHCGQKLDGYKVSAYGEAFGTEEEELEKMEVIERFATLPHYDGDRR